MLMTAYSVEVRCVLQRLEEVGNYSVRHRKMLVADEPRKQWWWSTVVKVETMEPALI